MSGLKSAETAYELARNLRKGSDIELSEAVKNKLGDLPLLVAQSHEITLIDCVKIVQRALQYVKDDPTLTVAKSELRHAFDSINDALEKWRFVPIGPSHVQYFERVDLFGPDVLRVFPAATEDIQDSGNCIAVGLNTPAVFCVMRAAEHGLRMLARKLKVRLTHKGKMQPVEYADWDKVITAIKNKIIHAKTSLALGPKRQERLERYSDAADHCVFMKDIWRNTISHARKPYTGAEAIAVLERVRDFLKFLAVQMQ